MPEPRILTLMNDLTETVCKPCSKLVSPAGARSAVIAAGEDFTVGQYTVGDEKLRVYLDGVYCLGGDDEELCVYREVGEAGTSSTVIQFHQDIPTTMEIVIIGA